MSTVHDMNNTFGNLNGGNESTNTRETPRKGGNVDVHMDGHGEQPGPTPGGGAGRSENLQGGSRERLQGGTGPTGRARQYRGDPAEPSLSLLM